MQPNRYQAIEHFRWIRDDGRTASIYGSCPWTTPAEKVRWRQESTGWTIYNPNTGQVGNGRPCHATKEACEAYIATLGQPSRIGIGD